MAYHLTTTTTTMVTRQVGILVGDKFVLEIFESKKV